MTDLDLAARLTTALGSGSSAILLAILLILMRRQQSSDKVLPCDVHGERLAVLEEALRALRPMPSQLSDVKESIAMMVGKLDAVLQLQPASKRA